MKSPVNKIKNKHRFQIVARFANDIEKDVLDKVKSSGLSYSKSENVDAPVINEYPLTLECKLVSYDDKTERVIGEVVNTLADDSILTDGKIDLAKFHPITYDCVNHHYLVF